MALQYKITFLIINPVSQITDCLNFFVPALFWCLTSIIIPVLEEEQMFLYHRVQYNRLIRRGIDQVTLKSFEFKRHVLKKRKTR